MKTFIRIIIISAMTLCALSAHAEDSKKYFSGVANKPDFDYTYVSPVMLKSMGDRFLNEADAGGMQLRSTNISSIETISTPTRGEDEDLWKIIRQLKKDKKLENLSTKKKDSYRYDMLARISGDGRYITHLMIITQNGSENVNVVYIEGKIPIDQTNLALL